MSNHQSSINNPSEVKVPAVVEGHMNSLFEVPSNKTGDDAPSTCAQQNPLYRLGTAPRVQFDQRNEMTVQVKFKIHTEKEVQVDQGTSIKVTTRGRKAAAASAVRYNLIESKMFNQGNILELVKCLFGKSLNEFKAMCGDICEVYEPGMRHMVLSSEIAPRLKWMGQVGREKITLVDHLTWQAFVDLLAKANKHKGSVIIFSENEKEKAKKDAQTSAAKELIASASGPTAAEAQVGVLTKELQDARNRIALHELTAQLFHEQSQKGTSGDGAILVCPWDPNFMYRLTWNGAWVWAKAVQSGMATREIPPRTYEYLAIMRKARVFHKATKVDDRVKMRSSQLQLDLSPTFHRSGGSHSSFFDPPAKLLFPKPSGSKRSSSYAALSGSQEDKPQLDLFNKKKLKMDTGFTSGKGITIELSSDPPSGNIVSSSQDAKIHVKKDPDAPSDFAKGMTIVISSDSATPIKMESSPDAPLAISQEFEQESHEEFKRQSNDHYADSRGASEADSSTADHAAALERFLNHCNVPPHDYTTRMILDRAGVKSWTDLIPSLQFTETSLTARGMHPALASHLLSEAMDRVNILQDEIDELPDLESPDAKASTTAPPSPEL